MKPGWLVGGGMLVGILIGILIAPNVRRDFSAPTADATGAPRITSRFAADGETRSNLKSSRDERSARPEKKKTEARISIPMGEASKLVTKQIGGMSWFGTSVSGEAPQYDPQVLADTLTLLNASETEKEEVNAVFKKVVDRLREAEATHVKLGKVTADSVELDASAMEGVLKEVTDQAKGELRMAMPDERGQLLEDNVRWDRLYRIGNFDRKESAQGEKVPPTLKFQIKRDKDKLMIWAHSGGSGSGNGVGDKYPDDGTPIPLEKVVGKRWQAIVSGTTLLPVEGN